VEHLGHGASFRSISEVVEYKNEALAENTNVPQSQLAKEFQPLMLSKQEVRDLVAFLENSLYDQNLERYVPQELPTGMCFPNADPQSIIDQGCAE
jgi:cytochrome c peroxidase